MSINASIVTQYFAAVLLVIAASSAIGFWQAIKGGIPSLHKIPLDLLLGLPLVAIGMLTGKPFPVVVGAGLLALFFHGTIAGHVDHLRNVALDILSDHIDGDPKEWFENEWLVDNHEFSSGVDPVEYGLLLDLMMTLREEEFIELEILEKGFNTDGDVVYRVASYERWLAWYDGVDPDDEDDEDDDFERDFERGHDEDDDE